MKYVRINDRIFAKTMRLICPEGSQLGVFPRDMALRKAQEFDLDLVEVAPEANPPVCRIMDFSKYRYDMEKKEKEAKKHQKQAQLKEMRFSPRIDIHDYEIKVRHVKEFLAKKHKVRVRMMFRGREIAHKDLGHKVINRLLADIADVGKIDKDAIMLGKTLVLVLAPK